MNSSKQLLSKIRFLRVHVDAHDFFKLFTDLKNLKLRKTCQSASSAFYFCSDSVFQDAGSGYTMSRPAHKYRHAHLFLGRIAPVANSPVSRDARSPSLLTPPKFPSTTPEGVSQILAGLIAR